MDLVQVSLNVIYFISLYYTVFWVLTYLEEEEPVKKKKPLIDWPRVSIVIPMYNEEENIISTIDNICDVDYPKDKLKIIVVDDGSKDKSFENAKIAVEKNKKKYPELDIKILHQENKGKYAAVNLGLKYVDTPFFATLDADSYPERDSLKKLIKYFYDNYSKDLAAVTPILKVYKPENLIQKMQWFEYAINHFYKSVLSIRDAIHVTPGPLALYKTKVVKHLGGFRPGHKTEDMELGMRLQKNHDLIKQCNDAIVYTKAPKTLRALVKQRLRWYWGTVKNVIDYSDMLFNKEYHDFGLFQLIMIPLSGVLAVALVFLMGFSMRDKIKMQYLSLKAYDFNIFEIIKDSFAHLNTKFWFLNLDLTSIAMMSVFLLIMVFLIYKGVKLFNRRFSLEKSYFIPLVIYILTYFYFLAFVWLIVFKDLIFKKEIKWK
ncbi:MAG: poly-beta,6-N-acetyl-D-glucosamine synthase [Candidatus Woesearchaeota archaeon]|nr:poly-beta,6-N-acetyl-D-glucosamine synthase [Candidatus Woesearchaeota archaeon]MDN5327737.1 poly-beta,6-N-acetyl-D-glucosamine synthase [Candidatus Woesearchaeota archaeon]